MKNHIFSIGLLAALAISCSIHEMDFKETNAFKEFYASIENTENLDTKVYATEELYLRWNADDRITIFNKYTYNQEYRFTGETGDNSGSFKRVDNGDFVTGNSLDNIYAIYPYQESTRISDTGVITVTLPAEQKYAENTMGLGANTMISATTDNQLLFKNVGGYLMLKLYGDDVTVSSISLKGNNGERIAGKATVSMSINGVPSVAMSETAGQEITLVCETPIKIGSTAETATTFWIVVPPTVFSKGFTLTVKDNKNGIFEKSTTKSFEISRNKLVRMSALYVQTESLQPKSEIWYTSTYGEVVVPYAQDVFGANIISNEYVDGKGILSFDGEVTRVGDFAFLECKNLKSIILPESVKTLGNRAFYSCINLSYIKIPNSVTSIGQSSFYDCRGLIDMTLPEGLITLPYELFYKCSSLTSITIPDSVTTIGRYAFASCSSLNSITIPEGVTSIGAFAFESCKSLTSIIIPNNVTKLEEAVFRSCTNLSSVFIPESVETIGIAAFANCVNLTSVTIPNNVISIEPGAFRHCERITSITIPDSVISIGYGAFTDCYSLVLFRGKFASSDGLYLIDSGTIISTARGAIKDIVYIPSGVTKIGDWAFLGNDDINAIIIPDGVISIGDYSFNECSSLSSIVLPKSLISIGPHAFDRCSSLATISLPENLSIIDEGAFSNCSNLISIVFPKSLTSIGNYAFLSCIGLTSIIIEGPNTQGGQSMFTNTNDCPIYVPASYVDAYKTAQFWSDYASRIQPLAPLPEAVDLGLSVKWASFNLGASKPEEYGDYYAWGETASKNDDSWATYKWCMGENTTLTRYCNKSEYGYNGFTDNKTLLEPEDDAAHVNLGGKWRVPTDAEWDELINNCTWTWTRQNGVNGRLVTAGNGNSVFLPAAGGWYTNGLFAMGGSGYYWSSFISTNNPYRAWATYFDSDRFNVRGYERCYRFSIRPVYAE